jgi:uncharacterized protein YkwD
MDTPESKALARPRSIARTVAAPRSTARSVTLALLAVLVSAVVAAPTGAAGRVGKPLSAHQTASGGCANADAPANHHSAAAMRAAVVCLVNRVRVGNRVPALREARRLDRSAQGWTNAMVGGSFFSHTGPGSDPGRRVRAQGFRWSAVGENIATGYATPREVVAAWLASTDHCHNLLDPEYRYVGTGVSGSPVGGYASGPATWTQDFGLPAGASAPSHNRGPANRCPY